MTVPMQAQPAPTLAPSGRSLGALAGKALRNPGTAIAYAIAITRGHYYRTLFRMLGRRFRTGARFRVFGRLSVKGPGEVVLGDNVALWGQVNMWTYSPEAKLVVDDDVMMGGTRFGCAKSITVGRDCILADASIRDTDFHSTRADRRSPNAPVRMAPVDIGRNVWVAAGAVLLPGTAIGENCVVGASAVCMRSFPADKIILGNPAKVAMPIPSMGSDATGAGDDPLAALS